MQGALDLYEGAITIFKELYNSCPEDSDMKSVLDMYYTMHATKAGKIRDAIAEKQKSPKKEDGANSTESFDVI